MLNKENYIFLAFLIDIWYNAVYVIRKGGFFMSDINKEKKFSGISVEHKKRTSLDDMHYMHSHIFNELYFLNSGKRRYFINNSIYDIVPGNLVIIPNYRKAETSH